MPEVFPTGGGYGVDQGREASAELPDADAEEQRRAAVEDPDDDAGDLDPERVVGRARPGQPGEQPLEASEGDVVEQSLEVPLDDEFDRD